MGNDPFFDREQLENLSEKEALEKIRQAQREADDWEAQNPDPQR